MAPNSINMKNVEALTFTGPDIKMDVMITLSGSNEPKQSI